MVTMELCSKQETPENEIIKVLSLDSFREKYFEKK